MRLGLAAAATGQKFSAPLAIAQATLALHANALPPSALSHILAMPPPTGLSPWVLVAAANCSSMEPEVSSSTITRPLIWVGAMASAWMLPSVTAKSTNAG